MRVYQSGIPERANDLVSGDDATKLENYQSHRLETFSCQGEGISCDYFNKFYRGSQQYLRERNINNTTIIYVTTITATFNNK